MLTKFFGGDLGISFENETLFGSVMVIDVPASLSSARSGGLVPTDRNQEH